MPNFCKIYGKKYKINLFSSKQKSPISGVESVTGNISPTIVANIVIASMIVTSEGGNIVIVIVANIVIMV